MWIVASAPLSPTAVQLGNSGTSVAKSSSHNTHRPAISPLNIEYSTVFLVVKAGNIVTWVGWAIFPSTPQFHVPSRPPISLTHCPTSHKITMKMSLEHSLFTHIPNLFQKLHLTCGLFRIARRYCVSVQPAATCRDMSRTTIVQGNAAAAATSWVSATTDVEQPRTTVQGHLHV
jgi:hypothetical protein